MAERPGREMKAWTAVGREAAADAPSARGSIGTGRQRRTGNPASEKMRSTRVRPFRSAARPRGRKSMSTAGRALASATSPDRAVRSDRSSGSATPAPSLDSPSAPNAPRWARAARPASASGRTRARDRPPASATNPTPHASCSYRASYSGAAGGRRRRVVERSRRSVSMSAGISEGDGSAAVERVDNGRLGERRDDEASAGREPGGAVPGRPWRPDVRTGRRPRRGLRGPDPSPRIPT